jgi:hypothetical protein
MRALALSTVVLLVAGCATPSGEPGDQSASDSPPATVADASPTSFVSEGTFTMTNAAVIPCADDPSVVACWVGGPGKVSIYELSGNATLGSVERATFNVSWNDSVAPQGVRASVFKGPDMNAAKGLVSLGTCTTMANGIEVPPEAFPVFHLVIVPCPVGTPFVNFEARVTVTAIYPPRSA